VSVWAVKSTVGRYQIPGVYGENKFNKFILFSFQILTPYCYIFWGAAIIAFC